MVSKITFLRRIQIRLNCKKVDLILALNSAALQQSSKKWLRLNLPLAANDWMPLLRRGSFRTKKVLHSRSAVTIQHWLIITQNWTISRYLCLYLGCRIHEFRKNLACKLLGTWNKTKKAMVSKLVIQTLYVSISYKHYIRTTAFKRERLIGAPADAVLAWYRLNLSPNFLVLVAGLLMLQLASFNCCCCCCCCCCCTTTIILIIFEIKLHLLNELYYLIFRKAISYLEISLCFPRCDLTCHLI